jgi:regulator of sigma E protease
MAVVSISLGVTNLLFFPPLDGFKMVLIVIEGIIRRPINEELNIKIQAAGFLLLIALAVYVTYKDILRLFGV